jgi:hypothetical protein
MMDELIYLHSSVIVALIAGLLGVVVVCFLALPKKKSVKPILLSKENDSDDLNILGLDFVDLLQNYDTSRPPSAIIRAFYHCEKNSEFPVIFENSSVAYLLKLIILLWIDSKCPQHRNLVCTDDAFDKEIQDIIQALELSMCDEGFMDTEYSSVEYKDIPKYLQLIQADPMKAFNPSKFTTSVYFTLLRLLRPIDTARLLFLIAKANQAADLISSDIEGKAIFFLGDTGSGKTSTLHYAGGSTFGTYEDHRGVNVYIPVKIINDALKSSTVSSSVSSVTLWPTAVPVVPSLLPGKEARSDKTVHAVDSPGFFDNRIKEVEFSNGYGLVNAMKKIKLLYPVITIDYGCTATRCKQFLETMKTLVQFMPDLQLHLESFSYVFTHGFPSNKTKQFIHESIKDVIQIANNTENTNPALLALLDDIRVKTDLKRGWIQAFIIDLKNPDTLPGDMLQAIMNSKPVFTANATFKHFCSNGAKIALSNYYETVKHTVVNSASFEGKPNFDKVNHHLGTMKDLYNSLKIDQILNVYSGCIRKIIEIMKSFRVSLVEKFCLNLNSIVMWKSEADKAVFISVCDDFDMKQNILFDAYATVAKHLEGKYTVTRNELERDVLGSVSATLLTRIESLRRSSPLRPLQGCEFSAIRPQLDRLTAASFRFPFLQNSLDLAEGELKTCILMTSIELRKVQDDWSTTTVVQYLADLCNAANVFGNEFQTNSTNTFNEAVQLIYKAWQSWITCTKQLLENSIMSVESKAELTVLAGRFADIAKTREFQLYCDNDTVQQIENTFVEHVCDYVQRLVSQIDEGKKLKGSELRRIDNYSNEIDSLLKIGELKEFTLINSFLNSIKSEVSLGLLHFAKLLAEDCDESLAKLEEESADPNSNKVLADKLSVIKDTPWINSLAVEDFRDFSKLKDRIIEAMKRMCSKQRNLRIHFDNYKLLPSLHALAQQLQHAKVLIPQIEEIKNDIEESEKDVKEKLALIIRAITAITIRSTEFTPADPAMRCISADEIERIEGCFESITALNMNDHDIIRAGQEYKTFLLNYRNAIKAQLSHCFQTIRNYTSTVEPSIDYQAVSDLFFARIAEVNELFDADKEFTAIYHEWMDETAVFTNFTPRQTGRRRIVHQTKSKVKQLHKDLEDELPTLRATNDALRLFNNSMICRYMMKVDELFPDNHQFSFRNLKDKFTEASEKVATDISLLVKQSFEAGNYDSVYERLKKLSKSDDPHAKVKVENEIDQIKHKLRKIKLDKIEIEKPKLHQMNAEIMSGFSAHYCELKKARDALREFLSESWIANNISDEYLTGIVELVATEIHRYANVANLLKREDFGQIEKRKMGLNAIGRILDSSGIGSVYFRHDDGRNEVVKITDLVQSIEVAIESKFEEMVATYSRTTDFQLLTSKIEFLDKSLRSLVEIEAYEVRWNQIKNGFINNILTQIQRISDNADNLSLKELKHRLDRLEANVKSWPANVNSEEISPAIDKARDGLLNTQANLTNRLENAFATNDYQSIVTGLTEAQTGGSSEILNRYRIGIQQKVLEHIKNVQTQLARSPIEFNTISADLQCITECKEVNMVSVLPTFDVSSSQLHQSITRFVLSRFGSVDSNANSVDDVQLELNQELIDRFNQYSEAGSLLFNIELSFPKLYESLKPSLEAAIAYTIDDVFVQFESYKFQFERALLQVDIQVLTKIFNRLRQLLPLSDIFHRLARARIACRTFEAWNHLWSLRQAQIMARRKIQEWTDSARCAFERALDPSNNHVQRKTEYEIMCSHITSTVSLLPFFPETSDRPIGSPAVELIFSEIKDSLRDKFLSFGETANEIIDNTNTQANDIERFSFVYDHLHTIVELVANLPELAGLVRTALDQIDQCRTTKMDQITDHVTRMLDEIQRRRASNAEVNIDSFLREIASDLLRLNNLRRLHAEYERVLDPRIREILSNRQFTGQDIFKIGDLLSQDVQHDGFDLVQREASIFEASLNTLRLRETAAVDFEAAITDLRIEPEIDREAMRAAYTDYKNKYDDLISERSSHYGGTESYVENVVLKFVNDNRRRPGNEHLVTDHVVWDPATKALALTLLPYVMALKSLTSSSCTWQPHPVQLLSIFCVFGVGKIQPTVLQRLSRWLFRSLGVSDDSMQVLENQLLEILTGNYLITLIYFTSNRSFSIRTRKIYYEFNYRSYLLSFGL